MDTNEIPILGDSSQTITRALLETSTDFADLANPGEFTKWVYIYFVTIMIRAPEAENRWGLMTGTCLKTPQVKTKMRLWFDRCMLLQIIMRRVKQFVFCTFARLMLFEEAHS